MRHLRRLSRLSSPPRKARQSLVCPSRHPGSIYFCAAIPLLSRIARLRVSHYAHARGTPRPEEPTPHEREPRMKRALIAACAVALTLASSTSAGTEDFYKGKTLTLVVGYASGGSYDINARLIARHLSRFIPGNPTVVVSNMPGAGSLRSVQYVQKIAPQDGTVLDMFDFTQITNSLLTPDKVPVDFRKFKWIGSVAQDVAVCYAWHTLNVKTLSDMQRLPVIQMGRTNPGSPSDIEQKILRKLFRVNVHSVAGYDGSAEGFIAVERGELNGGCITWTSLPP